MAELARRSFITGLIALVAAPAIVRAGSLMPVKTYVTNADDLVALLARRIDEADRVLLNNLMQVYYYLAPVGDLFGAIMNSDAKRSGDRRGSPIFRLKPYSVAMVIHG